MKKELKKKKDGFFADFKKFITRGNVLDMAVGVIVGGAFTAIVTAMTSNILQPLINWLLALIFPGNGLENAVTMLVPAYVVDEAGAITSVIDMANSIYINWGALISAIVNFLLVAFVLFLIVRIINRVNEAHEQMIGDLELHKKRAIRRICFEERVGKKQAKAIYEARVKEAREKKEAEAKAAAEAAAEAARVAEEKATANTRLLEEIRDLLKASKQ
jgi:large conductance mechanosensitive channel